MQGIQKRSIEPVLESNVSPLDDSIQEDDLPEALDSDTSFESVDEVVPRMALEVLLKNTWHISTQ